MKMKYAALEVAVLSLTACVACSQPSSAPGSLAKLRASWRAHFTDGRTELQRSFQAKRAATSFRMKTVLKLHPGRPMETVVEVSCPDRERMTTTIGGKSFRAIRLGGQAFVEQADGVWTTQVTDSKSWSPCGDNPGEPVPWAVMNEGSDPTTILAKFAKAATFERGQYVSTPAGECQEWIVHLRHPGGPTSGKNGITYAVCIDPTHHWPVQVVLGSGGMVVTYDDWNQPLDIGAPAGASAQSTLHEDAKLTRRSE